MRTHGTIQCRPAELFALEEQPRLAPAPEGIYDLPVYSKPKVHRDHHIEVGKALYSVPGNLMATGSKPEPTAAWSGCSPGAS